MFIVPSALPFTALGSAPTPKREKSDTHRNEPESFGIGNHLFVARLGADRGSDRGLGTGARKKNTFQIIYIVRLSRSNRGPMKNTFLQDCSRWTKAATQDPWRASNTNHATSQNSSCCGFSEMIPCKPHRAHFQVSLFIHTRLSLEALTRIHIIPIWTSSSPFSHLLGSTAVVVRRCFLPQFHFADHACNSCKLRFGSAHAWCQRDVGSAPVRNRVKPRIYGV